MRAILGLLVLCASNAWAQSAFVGPVAVVSEYREASTSLRYTGVGPGADATVQVHRFRAEAVASVVQMNPDAGSAAAGFRATEVDAWIGADALPYLSVEVGVLARSPNVDFAAQSLGAVATGVRTHFPLGPGVTVSLRGDYLAAAQFSGGGSAPFAVELGLGLEARLTRHLRAEAAYGFQRLDRKTSPAGGPTTSVPIEDAQARVGFSIGR